MIDVTPVVVLWTIVMNVKVIQVVRNVKVIWLLKVDLADQFVIAMILQRY